MVDPHSSLTAQAPARPSVLHLPRGDWPTVLDCLCARFPAIARERWIDRFARGRVLDAQGVAINAEHPYREGLRIIYFREVPAERPIPFSESIIHVDDHLVVADKPHFLPVTPSGGYVEQTLLARLTRRLGNPRLSPLHRIDRHTAGLVLFSANPATRSLYQSLFAQRAVAKTYEAIAPALPRVEFPLTRTTRLAAGEPFFRMRESDGEPNTETRIDVLERHSACWRYALYPVTGKKHQLRVHMAALGAPIRNNPMYPELNYPDDDDYTRPLQLLARDLAFIDPMSGQLRQFRSGLSLTMD